jgi:hypothetical protein
MFRVQIEATQGLMQVPRGIVVCWGESDMLHMIVKVLETCAISFNLQPKSLYLVGGPTDTPV